MRQLNIMIRVLIVVVALSLAMLAHAAEVPLWIVAEGESYQGDADTLKEVRDRAKRDAETRAIENAVGTFIKSHTLVSNHQIAEDLVYAAVRGKITKEEIISSGWDAANRNLYRVKIKALVAPIHREKGNENGESLEAENLPFKSGSEGRGRGPNILPGEPRQLCISLLDCRGRFRDPAPPEFENS